MYSCTCARVVAVSLGHVTFGIQRLTISGQSLLCSRQRCCRSMPCSSSSRYDALCGQPRERRKEGGGEAGSQKEGVRRPPRKGNVLTSGAKPTDQNVWLRGCVRVCLCAGCRAVLRLPEARASTCVEKKVAQPSMLSSLWYMARLLTLAGGGGGWGDVTTGAVTRA